MADQVKMRGGSESSSNNFTGAAREVTVDTSLWTLRVHDGVTPGGHKLLKSGNCLVVEEADQCNPNKPTCKVTVNGELDVEGDVHIGGDLTIDGNIDLGDIVLDLYTDDVTLKNPGDYVADCNVPDGNGLKTQADANKWFYEGISILDEKLCIAQKEIQVLEKQYQDLEVRVDQNEIDIAELKAEIANLKQEIIDIENAIKLLEIEIENNANTILNHEGRISALEAQIDQINIEIEELKDALANLKLDDLVDCAVPNPKNGQQLVFRNGLWVAEDDPFTNQAVHFMGFVNVEDDTAPTGVNVKPGDTYIQHKVDETVATANSTWVGIVSELVAEGQYVMYGADLKWHKGKTVENVTQIQSDWTETDVSSPAFIKSKPDIQGTIDASIGTGNLKIQTSAGVELGTFNANQDTNELVTLPEGFSGDYGDLDNIPTKFPPEAHGHAWGEITGKPSCYDPCAHRHEWNELDNVPTEFPPENHTHSYNDLTDKPIIPDPFPEAPADGNVYVRNGQSKSWIRGLPYDVRTLPELP